MCGRDRPLISRRKIAEWIGRTQSLQESIKAIELNLGFFSVYVRAMAPEGGTKGEEREKFTHEAMAHLDHLYRVALYLAKKSNEAEDLVQETYARALGSYKQFIPGTNMKAWLTMILQNFFFDQYCEKKRWISVEHNFAEEETSGYWEKVPIDKPGPESQILLKELSGKISDVLSKISHEFRLAVILVDMGDFSYEEAAEILSCPLGTIRSRLARGRRLIYKHLKGYVGIKKKNERKK
jgi:RNA polymerase sigma-70 factor, ECF subfamily